MRVILTLRPSTHLCQARGQRLAQRGEVAQRGEDSHSPFSRATFGPRRCLRATMATGDLGRGWHCAFAATVPAVAAVAATSAVAARVTVVR